MALKKHDATPSKSFILSSIRPTQNLSLNFLVQVDMLGTPVLSHGSDDFLRVESRRPSNVEGFL